MIELILPMIIMSPLALILWYGVLEAIDIYKGE